jgi:hypothetical protein
MSDSHRQPHSVVRRYLHGRRLPWASVVLGRFLRLGRLGGHEPVRSRRIPRWLECHIRPDGLQRERNLHLEPYPLDCPAHAAAERARIYPCPCMLRRYVTPRGSRRLQRSSLQANCPSEEQWNCRGPQVLALPLSNIARAYNVVPPAPALTVPAPQGPT